MLKTYKRVGMFVKVTVSEYYQKLVWLTWAKFSLLWLSLGFDVGHVQNHKRWSTLIQRIPFRSSSQVNVDTIQIPFSHHVFQRWWSWTKPSRTQGSTKAKKTWLRCGQAGAVIQCWVTVWSTVLPRIQHTLLYTAEPTLRRGCVLSTGT